MTLKRRVGSSPTAPTKLNSSEEAYCVTLPITLPQRQAYASNTKWQSYGSNPISCRAVLKAVRTSLSRKHPGLTSSFEIATSLG